MELAFVVQPKNLVASPEQLRFTVEQAFAPRRPKEAARFARGRVLITMLARWCRDRFASFLLEKGIRQPTALGGTFSSSSSTGRVAIASEFLLSRSTAVIPFKIVRYPWG